MSDNQANPLKEAETDVQRATKTIAGLLNPQELEKKEEVKTEETENSPDLTQEESSNEDQPQEQETMEEESQEETSEEVSQDEEQIETQEKQDSPLHKVKVNGQEFEVTLDELRNGYSRDADYRRKTEELSLERKQVQSESEKQRQDYSSKLNELGQIMSVAAEQFNSEISEADLDKLYDEDPTEAAKIERRMRKKQDQFNSAFEKVKEEQQNQHNAYVAQEYQKLAQKIPEFNDRAKARKLTSEISDYLSDYGFTIKEMANIHDHRQIMLITDAIKYRNMQKVKPTLAKKISKPGKVFTSGIKKDKSDINSMKAKEKLSRLKKTGSAKDAASIFLDMINNK